jgi:hypothetical protein
MRLTVIGEAYNELLIKFKHMESIATSDAMVL